MNFLEIISVVEKMVSEGEKPENVAQKYIAWLESNGNQEQSSPIWFNLGVIYSGLGLKDKSAECYQNAIHLNKTLWQAIINLGHYYESNEQTQKAIELYEGVLSIAYPLEGKTSIRNQLGRLLENNRQFKKASQAYEDSLSLNPDQKDTYQHWFFLRQKQCIWPVSTFPKPLTYPELANRLGTIASMAYFDDPAMIKVTVSEWINRYREGKIYPHLTNSLTKYNHPKIRIGYVSCDFRMHAVCFLSAQIYELHDREKFEVFAYDFSKVENTKWRQRIIDGVDHFFSIHEMKDDETANLIQSHEIDILIDMVGLTSGARPGIFMYKPAPIQISYLGFLGPVGIKEIDYLLCDEYVVPEKFANDYGVKPLYVPFYQVNNQLRESSQKPSRASQGLPENAFVYCVINNSYKITQEVFSRWMLILKKTDNTILWLLEENESVRENLILEANRLGVSVARLVFASPVPPEDYLARFQCADLFLDTSPYNAGITASDALWMGLPVLTCPGNTFTSRMAADLLMQLDLNELVCNSWPEYERKAISYSLNQDLKNLMLTKNIRDSHVFDSKLFVKNFEKKLIDCI